MRKRLDNSGSECYEQLVMSVEESARATFRHLPPDKQEKVLDAALAEFADHGYHQASLNRLVSQAGIAKGSLYQYFPNKEGVFHYVFQYALGLVRDTLVRVKEESREDDLFTRLEKSLKAGTRFVRQHPRIFSLYLKIQFERNIPYREEFLALVRRYATEYFESLVRRAKFRGELRPGLSEAAALFLLDAVFDRFLQAMAVPALDVTLGLYQAPEETLNRRIREIVDLLRDGLMA